jgi:glycosyltransferase involved in cell wall biosynthesis
MTKLLIITQSVDSEDQALGFFIGWIKEFAKNCEKVSVICLRKGKYDLPANVLVYSLGKELRERSDLGNLKRSDLEEQFQKIKYAWRFYKRIFSLRNEYDSVFVHMNYIYVLLGDLFWKVWNKKVALWYVHRQKSFGLWLSQIFVNNIFTSSSESFGYKSKKVLYVGHGVDSSKFICSNNARQDDKTKIIHVGRITPIKNLETLILATEILIKKVNNLSVELIGKPATVTDEKYFTKLKSTIKDKHLENVVTFKGAIPSAEIAGVYCSANTSVNLAPTGGWDKTVIESIMAKCPVFASNQGLKPIFGEYADKFLFEQNNPLDLANKIESFLDENDKDIIMGNLRNHAVNEYGLENLIRKIVLVLNK